MISSRIIQVIYKNTIPIFKTPKQHLMNKFNELSFYQYTCIILRIKSLFLKIIVSTHKGNL